MTDYRDLSLDNFIRCPIPGCEVKVLSITGDRNRCRAHGGHLPEIRVSIDGTLSAPAAGSPSSLPAVGPLR